MTATITELTIRQECGDALDLLAELMKGVDCVECAPLANVILSNVVSSHFEQCPECQDFFEIKGEWTPKDVQWVIATALAKVRS